MVHAMHRAFSTTTTYLIVQEICSSFNTIIFSRAALEHCIKMVMNHGGNKESRHFVEENIQKDFQAGKRWHNYAAKLGGYGIFFLIGMVPSWM